MTQPPDDELRHETHADELLHDHATPRHSEPLSAPPPGDPPSYVFLAIVAVISLVADLATKRWAERALQLPNETPTPKTIIKGFFTLALAKNKGGAFGFLQNAGENVRKPFFVVVSVLAILFIVSLYRRLHPSQRALRWGLPLVLGGALGNLVDRICYGHVIDFLDVQASYKGVAHHWPTFNVADIAICIGVGLMALDMLSARRHPPESFREVEPASASTHTTPID
jgi:signal peptidase II